MQHFYVHDILKIHGYILCVYIKHVSLLIIMHTRLFFIVQVIKGLPNGKVNTARILAADRKTLSGKLA